MTAFQSSIPSSETAPYPANFLSAIPVDNDDLHWEITTLAGHINAANYRFLKLLAALVERGAWNGGGIKTPAHWLNYYCGISMGPARERVRVALALQNLPLIDAAFSTGEISYSKVRAMTRVATLANEDYWLNIARHGTASHVETLVRKYQRVKRLNSAEQEKDRQDTRTFSCYYDDDGMLVFQGRLAPEDGALFLKAMDAVLHQCHQERQGRDDDIDETTHVADDVSAETSIEDASDTFPQKRADALVKMAEHYLATDEDGVVALNGGDKYQVVVHVDATSGVDDPAEDQGSGETQRAWLENGPVLSSQTVRRLAEDAALVTVLEDGEGKVLNVGRKTRTIPPSIRRALTVRDGGCRFPGCCESKYVDAHHIHHWCDGGETRLDNLVLLCRHHHRLVHEEGYSVAMEDRQPVFTTPAGESMQQAPCPQFPAIAAKKVSAETFFRLEQEHVKFGLEIDAHTAVTAWRGEHMDYGMGVEALLRRDM